MTSEQQADGLHEALAKVLGDHADLNTVVRADLFAGSTVKERTCQCGEPMPWRGYELIHRAHVAGALAAVHGRTAALTPAASSADGVQ